MKALLIKSASFVKRIIAFLENPDLSIVYSLAVFLAATTFRNFLEIFSDHVPVQGLFFTHYYLSYLCLALALTWLFHWATGEDLKRIIRLVLASFVVVILAPILDLIISGGSGYNITYLLPEKHGNLWLRLITFFGNFSEKGITPGMRIEIGLVIIGSLIYFQVKSGKLLRSLVFTILTYLLIFFYCAIPYPLKAIVELLGMTFGHSPLSYRNLFLLISFILAFFIVWKERRNFMIPIFKDIRPARLMHFLVMFGMGYFMAHKFSPEPIRINQDTLISGSLALISIAGAWLFSVMTNNIQDQNIDRISNPGRPLTAGIIHPETYKQISWLILILTLVLSLSVNFAMMFFVLLFMCNYYLYSMPPFRLKRLTFISKIVISLNSFIMVVMGYYFAGNTAKTMPLFPGKLALYFLIFITGVMNFIDLKDYEGDKAAGIKTLPVIFGPENSKMIIGAFFMAAYIGIFFFFNFHTIFLYLLITLGVVQFMFINFRRYSEWPVFILYFLSLLLGPFFMR
ncbi:UbiA prenyltransferase family protein [bacterium]|nr:UbiA prenyltransferase family protein [bacterium]